MIGELHLSSERGPVRSHRAPRRSRKGLTFLLVVLLLAGLGGGGLYGYRTFFTAPDYSGPGSGETVVQVKSGDTATAIGNTLYTSHVVKSAAAFIDAATNDTRSKGIQVGYYKVKTEMKAVDALGMLLDPKNLWVDKVTLPEGLTYLDTIDKLAAATKLPKADFLKAAKDPVALGVPSYWFTRSDGKKADKTDIEGFLYPDTYQFSPKATAADVLKQIVSNFNSVMTKLNFVSIVRKQPGISPYQALIAASIAQEEAARNADMPKVVKVLYNRAYSGTFPCNCLQLDSTVNYWLKISGQGAKASENLTKSELHNANDPYNTHDVAGLPIGPIGNPGKAAIQGAENPTPNFPYVYFVAVDKNGTTLYAKTYTQHLKNIQVACNNGIPLCQ